MNCYGFRHLFKSLLFLFFFSLRWKGKFGIFLLFALIKHFKFSNSKNVGRDNEVRDEILWRLFNTIRCDDTSYFIYSCTIHNSIFIGKICEYVNIVNGMKWIHIMPMCQPAHPIQTILDRWYKYKLTQTNEWMIHLSYQQTLTFVLWWLNEAIERRRRRKTKKQNNDERRKSKR